MKRHLTKRRAVALAVATTVLAATAAFAYFTALGSGTGSARTGSVAALTITQVGAGYDSLVTTQDPNSEYIQDQCFQCAQIGQFGNSIHLANSGLQRLVSATVAMRNWDPAATPGVPITLQIIGGPSSTATVTIPAAQPSGRPTTFNVPFSFPTHPFVNDSFVYSISFPTTNYPVAGAPNADGLNVALSNSLYQLSVGSDTAPGTVWVATGAGAGIAGDFPSCTTPSGNTFQSVSTNCGPAAAGNPGAYGTNSQVTAGNADIPAVQFNVVGGVAAPLYPGEPPQPVDFAITNPGGGPVHVSDVKTTITGTNKPACDSANPAPPNAWYQMTPPGASVLVADATNGGSGWSVPPGTTIISPSGVSILMIESGTDQSACESATVNLSFSST